MDTVEKTKLPYAELGLVTDEEKSQLREDLVRLAERQAQGWIAGIVGINQKQVVRQGADVARAQHHSLSKLPLDRKKIVLGVRVSVPWHGRSHTLLRGEDRKICGRVRISDGSI